MDLVVYIFVAIFAADVVWDWYKIEKQGRQIKHGLDTAIAVGLYAAALVVLALVGKITWVEALGVAIVYPALRWLAHDLALNLLRGKKWDYVGVDQHSALTDKLIVWLRGWRVPAWFARAIAIAISFVLQNSIIGGLF